MRRTAVLLTALVLTATGCGTSGTVARPAPVRITPYAGPLDLPVAPGDEATVTQRAGSAARALECDGAPADGGSGAYDSGLETAQSTAEGALRDFLDSESVALVVPRTGYRVERRDRDRVLLSYDVDGRTRVAFVAETGVRDYRKRTGWGISAWATCDQSELPAAADSGLSTRVWLDSAGHRVPTSQIRSYDDACDSAGTTFLLLGPEVSVPPYVRDLHREMTSLLTSAYRDRTTLPRAATDTGFGRDGRRLWLSADRLSAYLVSTADPRDVQLWPRARRAIACG